MKKQYHLTEEMQSRLKSDGFIMCPECQKPMQHMKTPQVGNKKDEFYCSDCHISVPLFKK